MRVSAIICWAVLSVWMASGIATAATEAPAGLMQRVAFLRAPAQVQHDLIRALATCGESAKQVRALATFDVGPIGGPRRQDYFFQSGPGIGDGRVSICTGNYTWQLLWMHLGKSRYKMFTQTNNLIFIGPTRSVLFDADSESNCAVPGARGWSDNGRFWEWSPKAAAFRPITRCMLLEDAKTWAKARGYQVGESY